MNLPKKVHDAHLSKRLQLAAKLFTGGQRALALKLDVHRNTFGKWTKGEREPTDNEIKRIADLVGLNEVWLRTGEGGQYAGPETSEITESLFARGLAKTAPPEWRQFAIENSNDSHVEFGFEEDPSTYLPHPSMTHLAVAFFEVRPSAGNGRAVLSQTIEDYFSLPRDWLARLVPPTTRIGIMQAAGDSMEPGIRDGDIMIVRFDIDRIRDDGVYVISYDGDIRVKRLTVNLGEIILSSDNPRYQDQRIPRAEADERLIVHGQVFWSGGAIRAGR